MAASIPDDCGGSQAASLKKEDYQARALVQAVMDNAAAQYSLVGPPVACLVSGEDVGR